MAAYQTSPQVAGNQVPPSSSARIEQACDAGMTFAKLFYEKLDKGRTSMVGLFHENATLVWNGNNVHGKANVIAFLEKLPVTETTLSSIDAQPILDIPCLGGQATITVIVGGRQKLGSGRERFFTESFMLTAEQSSGGVWKVVSDNYRNFE
ncbi:NTF2-related export protein 2 [Halotydeus destructor]|nr:NTF2-related export protein 2 [Halotydeus destructor]